MRIEIFTGPQCSYCEAAKAFLNDRNLAFQERNMDDQEVRDEFRRRYFAELDANPDGVAELRSQLGKGTATLVFGSRETEVNNACALREYLAKPL